MALTKEYQRKIEVFIEKFPKRMYKALGEIGFSGFFTYDRLSLEEAAKMERQSMPKGLKWGKKWEYGWFFADITIPESLDGKRVLFAAELGECVVFVNGQVFGAFDQRHSHITLTKSARAGEVFHIAMEVYAGHDGVEKNGLLVSPKNFTILIPEENITEFPEDITQKVVNNGTVGILEEEVFQLWMDMSILYDLRNNLEGYSMRTAMIEKGLKKVCDYIDIEEEFEEFKKQAIVAREMLKPLLECRNGSTAPTLYAIGNSHLDLEWVWTVNETRRKCARTLGNQLKLIEDYPEYKYIHSQPWTLEVVKNEYPELYERVKKAVDDGNIIVEGGAWVEPDTNLPSGESLIRQFLFGKKFIKEEFGKDSEIFWLPDSFGMSGSLPQILKGCGIKYFMNAKVTWLYNDGERFPHNNFMWEGIDGSKVLTHITEEYATEFTPSKAFEKWMQNPEKEDVPVRIFPYGYGDGGGGATRVHLEALRRTEDLEGHPKMISESPNKMFEYISENCDVKKNYVGEIYYAAHRGTYTSQAKTKKGNRRAEFALREAELWSALLGTNTKTETDAAWKKVLFNQFHDIIPGSSLKEVHERAEKSYAEAIDAANAVCNKVLVTERREDKITVFNSLSWGRKAFIELPAGYTSLEGCEAQRFGKRIVALVDLPSCGVKSYKLGRDKAEETKVSDSLILENNLIRAEFNSRGEMISLFDKEKQMEFLSAPSNVFKMYKDMPTFCDSWDIDSYYENVEVELEDAVAEPEYSGNLVSSLVITKKINKSEVKQRVILKKDRRCIEFETEVDWRESHRLLKVDYNTNIHTDKLISEVQFGYIERPTHSNRQHDAERFEVSQQKWSALCEGKRGIAILNDCKYGISGNENRMSLTLLKAGAMPDLNADKGKHSFKYAVMPICESLCDSNVVREGYELNSPVIVKNGFKEEMSLLGVSEKNIIIDTVKTAEDGSGDIIIRLYECMNTETKVSLSLGFDIKSAYVTDMLENIEHELEIKDNKIDIKFHGFEVKTIRVLTNEKRF